VTSMILADYGATVVKVESPGGGPDRDSPARAAWERGKRSVTLDLTAPEGPARLRSLIAGADVFVESFRPGVADRLGFGYDRIHREQPATIYCSITGYGQDGPYSDRPGYDGVFQAQGGLMSVTGYPDDAPGGGPMKCGPSLVDVTAGYISAIGILAALQHADRTGEGQQIDSNLMDAVVSLQSSLAQAYLISRQLPKRSGHSGNGGHPAGLFECADGSIYISAGNNAHYVALCTLLGLPHLIGDKRFLTSHQRFQNKEQWLELAGPTLKTWKRQPLLDALIAAGVPCGPVNNYEDLFADPHVRARNMVVEMENPIRPGTQLEMLASPLRLSKTPVAYRYRPPNIGEHTDEVLIDTFGLTEEEVARYRALGVLGEPAEVAA
jgi:crotonobetainyl-CoA:carnitine CoA-transferase CaiB-like acyl-CoA transferase